MSAESARPGITLLHLTDLHYGAADDFLDDDKAGVPVALRERALEHLRLMIQQGFAGPVDLVAVTGDTTTRGAPEGFASFRDEIGTALCKLTGDARAVCVVPGNHDVKWDVDDDRADYFDEKFRAYAQLVRQLGVTSSIVPTGKLPRLRGERLRMLAGIGDPIHVDRNKRLLVLCINSSMRCGERDSESRRRLAEPLAALLASMNTLMGQQQLAEPMRQGIAETCAKLARLRDVAVSAAVRDVPHLTDPQLTDMARRLVSAKTALRKAGEQWDDYFKVALLHHHLLPFSRQLSEHKPFEIMADAARLLDALAKFGFHLVLTGHKHHPYAQRAEFGGGEILVAGGSTVGGMPAVGSRPGVRVFEVTRQTDAFDVRWGEVFCDELGDATEELHSALAAASPVRLYKRAEPVRGRSLLPRAIEEALDKQLYSRAFYKKDVVFDIVVTRKAGGKLCFTTTMSYEVINMQDREDVWRAEYNFDAKSSRALALIIDGTPLDPDDVEFRRGRGISVPCTVAPAKSARVEIKVEETFAETGTNLFTSYFPAADLKLALSVRAKGVHFDCEVLYAWKDWPVKSTADGLRVEITQGLLPYQGVRLSWKPKGRAL